MANPFQQQSRLRKVVYFGLILALFTISLFHRKFIIEPKATALQLREQAQGEVELTSSAVRLSLTGSRGLATCILWQTAIERQKKHQWNEMELLVNSITKLQPHFVTPWLFQSWNLAFNVAVECDRTRDKYFYVTRGLYLLAEGERRNQGSLEAVSDPTGKAIRFPGNPDMRFHMGFTYQLKIGNSDEKYVMRCLLDLSCIDPLKRDPDKLWATLRGVRVVDLKKFDKFCEQNPRLVRRLREQVRLDSPKRIVDFLRDNKDVPSRFEPPAGTVLGQEQSELKGPRQQFPILPPRSVSEIPDTTMPEFPDAFDVYRAAQAWYIYAQEPLPPAFDDPGMHNPQYNPSEFRIPKMATHIFRGYPARAQAYIGENLQEEGWFDESGWLIKDWFDNFQVDGKQVIVVVGREPKYHATEAWEKAYRMYFDYGSKNGLYLSPKLREELEAQARLYRSTPAGQAGVVNPELRREDRLLEGGKMGKSFDAQKRLFWNRHYRQMTNFDTYLYMTEAERQSETAEARKELFYAAQLRAADPLSAIPHYEKGFSKWLEVLLAHPGFRAIPDVQIETYEAQMRYLKVLRDLHPSELRDLTSFLAEFGMVRPLLSPIVNFPVGLARCEVEVQVEPTPERKASTQIGLVCPVMPALGSVVAGLAPVPSRWREARLLDEDQVKLILPFRIVRGPFEKVFVCDVPHQETLKDTLLALTQATQPLPLTENPWLKNRMLTVWVDRDLHRPAPPWVALLGDDIINQTRDRYGMNRARPAQGQPEPAPAPTRPRKGGR